MEIIGLRPDGTKLVDYWCNLNEKPGIASKQNMTQVCPDFGTVLCLSCELGLLRPLDMCDCNCSSCRERGGCPCTRAAWQARQNE